jgi:hypothetical protein
VRVLDRPDTTHVHAALAVAFTVVGLVQVAAFPGALA